MNAIRPAALQIFLRIVVSVSFLSAVADRFGFWGSPGAHSVSWGNWENFVAYSQSVNSFVSPALNDAAAVIATVLEILLPILLLTGYKIKLAALASGVLLCCFAIAMTYSLGIKQTFDYSVWTAAAASFALGSFNSYNYSIDYLIAKRRRSYQ